MQTMHTQQLSLANSGAQSDAKIGHTVLDTLCQLASESEPHSDTLLTDMRQELPVSEVLRQWMDEVRETEPVGPQSVHPRRIVSNQAVGVGKTLWI